MKIHASARAVVASKSLAVQPGKGALGDPTPWQHHKSFGCIRSFDDFNGSRPQAGQGVCQFLAGIAAIGKQVTQPRIKLANGGDGADRAVPILDAGHIHCQPDQVFLDIRDDMALAAFDFLPVSGKKSQQYQLVLPIGCQ